MVMEHVLIIELVILGIDMTIVNHHYSIFIFIKLSQMKTKISDFSLLYTLKENRLCRSV